MNPQNWTIQKIEGGTKITVSAEPEDSMMGKLPVGSITTVPKENARTTMEILKTAFQTGKEIAQNRMTTTNRIILGRESHMCVFERLCKTKVLFVAGNGYDLIIQRACECGKRISIDSQRVIL